MMPMPTRTFTWRWTLPMTMAIVISQRWSGCGLHRVGGCWVVQLEELQLSSGRWKREIEWIIEGRGTTDYPQNEDLPGQTALSLSPKNIFKSNESTSLFPFLCITFTETLSSRHHWSSSYEPLS